MHEDELRAWRDEQGYMRANFLPDGRIVALLRTPTGGQIIIGTEFDVEERYSFESFIEASVSLLCWDWARFEREPIGWVRHQPSNRRRRYELGRPTEEWVAP